MKLKYINAFTKVNPKKTVILLTTTTLLIILVWQYTLAQLRHFFQFDCQSKESCKIHSRQSRIIKKLILEGRLFHPSDLPYNTSVQVTDTISVLNAPDAFTSYTADTNSFWIDAVIAIETFIPKKDRRYFLEYNAGDGFTHSATLHLEKFLGWTGVLIEPNKTLFEELKHVQRKAFAVNACILAPNNCKLNPGSLASSELKNVKWQQEEEICLALRSILFETNLTSIDLFILKVSKGSLEVLQTIPFESVNISFFAIEVSGLAEESVISLHMFLYSKKYIFYDRFASRKNIFSMFIEESYYSDEAITKTIREMSPLSYLKIIIGSFDENMDTNILKQFAMSNYLYSLQS